MDGGASRVSEGSKELVEVGGGQAGGAPPHRRLDRRAIRPNITLRTPEGGYHTPLTSPRYNIYINQFLFL